MQGALKLILEPIFEADFHDGSYGYRPKRNAHDAVARVTTAILEGKTQVIDWIWPPTSTRSGTIGWFRRWRTVFRMRRSCTA